MSQADGENSGMNATTRRSARIQQTTKNRSDREDGGQASTSKARRGQRGTTTDESVQGIADLASRSTPVTSGADKDDNDDDGGVEVVAEDDTCPICQLLFHRPVVTSCKHTLCESCMATWADVSVLSQMQIVDLDHEFLNGSFDAVSGLEARCPMCRTQTSAVLNRARTAELKAKYPKTYAEREREERGDDNTDAAAGTVQTLTLCIGNRHRLVGNEDDSDCPHDWTFFVRPSRTDIIEEVHIHLHPTFRPPRIIRTREPYEVRRLGWGYFTIVAEVMLKAGYSWVSEDAQDSPDGAEKGMLALEWTLDFDRFGGRGSMGRLRLKVRNQREWEDVSDDEEEEDARIWQRLVRQYERDGGYVPDEEV